MGFKRIGKKEFHNIREWIGMALWVSAAILLAFGVIRVPGKLKGFFQTHILGRQESVSVPKVLILYVGPIGPMVGQLAEALAVPRSEGKIQVTAESVSLSSERGESRLSALLAKESPRAVFLVSDSPSDAYVFEIQAFRSTAIQAGPQRYLSRLPIHEMQRVLTKAGYKATINYTDKTFSGGDGVRDLFYRLMNQVASGHPGMQAGYIQIPGLGPSGKKTQEEWSRWVMEGLSLIVHAALD